MINVEYCRSGLDFPKFYKNVHGKSICAVCDVNTRKYAEKMINKLGSLCGDIQLLVLGDCLVPDEKALEALDKASIKSGYILGVGSGTLNDMSKYISTEKGISCGILATAPSMDGYASKGAALMLGGKKVTKTTNSPADILVDYEVLSSAPRLMVAAGFGDIVGKYTCLADWKLSNALNGEPIDLKAFSMMEKARGECVAALTGLARNDGDALKKLMEALIAAGLAMAECGNSRPASGSEHHISHFFETDFVKKGLPVPLHGIKVGIGTLISLEIYHFICDNKIKFEGCEKVYEIAGELPSVNEVKDMLIKIGCPVRFSEIGVQKDVMDEMIDKAYTMRDRFTVLTLVHNLGLTPLVKPIIMEKYF